MPRRNEITESDDGRMPARPGALSRHQLAPAASRLQPEQNDFDLREVLAQVRSLFDAAAAQKGLSLSVRAPAELDTRVRGDAMRLLQLLRHLVGNAIRFTQRGGVSVTLASADGTNEGLLSYRITVADSGIGIAPGALARAFEPVEQIVKAFGGDIGVESAVGRGSTFTFTCCLAKPLQLEKRRVLLAEDNPVNQLHAQAILDGCSCDTTIADNGRLALECWRSSPFDLILMDCHMPDMDGFESARAIRAEEQSRGARRTAIVGITASMLPADRDACLAAGMDDVLVKPLEPQAFLDVVQRWCINSGSRR